MPRRRQRFADLEKQFRQSGGQAAPGSALAAYINWKQGKTKINVRQTLTKAQRKRYGHAILPFGLSVGSSPGAGDRYAAAITAYSNDGRKALGLTDSKLGYDALVGATIQDDNFYPALLRVFVPDNPNAAPVEPTSAITLKPYKRMVGKSYGVPFGRTLTSVVDKKTGAAETTLENVDEEDVRTALAAAARAGAAVKATSVSFEPEVFKIGSPNLTAPPP